MSWPSRAERERLERFPLEIALEDLRESFTLKAGDRDLVFSQQGSGQDKGEKYISTTESLSAT
jgi:hypothetical protein